MNLCDYWDGLQGIIAEAAEYHSNGSAPPLRRLSVFVTDLCNMRCRDCRVDFNSPQSIDLGWLAEQFAQARQMGAFFLDVMGLGEPTLLPGLPNLLKQASAHGLICTIGTNGATTNLQNREYLGRLLEISPIKIRVSLDSADAGVHDRLRGGNSTWHKAVRFIQKVVEARTQGRLQASIFINCVVRASSLGQTLENISFFADLGVDDVHLIPIRYVSEEFCSVEQIHRYNCQIAPQIQQFARQHNLAWAATNAYLFGQSEAEIELASRGMYYLPMRAGNCYALKSQLVLDACRRPFTCLWGKRAGGRPIFDQPVQELQDLRRQLVPLSYPAINPIICQSYCTREVIAANNQIEAMLYAAGYKNEPG